MFSERVQSRGAKREATRDRVLLAAERLFRDQGFGATTVRQIAAEAEVSTGTVMSAGDKDALLVAIFDSWIDAVHRARAHENGDTSASASPPAPPPLSPDAAVDAVMDLVAPFVQYFARDEDLSRQYAAVIVRGTHESAIFQELARSLTAEFTGVLARAGLAGDDRERGARAVYYAYLGVLMTVSHGALDEAGALDQVREVTGFVTGRAGGAA
ncbi:TetR/AcrR family transcriptional regulator [Streptomyces sp. NPDC048172]|uniref:TetR/AcrR family transcriptional regulator n=1 Tax=Streptomyces sp. NPDC048172 TaxID=3365505 RepID=UPI00371551FA